MYTKINLNRPKAVNPGSASQKNEIVLVEAEDLEVFPKSDSKGVKLAGNPVLKSGGKFIKIYSTKSKTDAPMETEGDEDMMSFAHKFVAQYPGNGLEIKEFIQNWTGRNIIIFHKACGEAHYEVMGTPCAPLQLKSTKKDDNEGRGYTLEFDSFAKSGFVPKVFEGEIPFVEPFSVVDLTEIPVNETNGNQYKLPATSGVVAFDTVELDHGALVSLIGSGGATSATLSSGLAGTANILLVDGVSWSAESNAVIHLQVFKTDTVTFLIELSRD